MKSEKEKGEGGRRVGEKKDVFWQVMAVAEDM